MRWPLSLLMLSRDWRSGELRVLAAALALAVTAVTAVGFFTDRVQGALESQATQLLGADLVISSDHRLSNEVLSTAPPRLQQARAVEFPSMVIAGEETHLASIQAVSSDYPLRGELRISRQRFTTATVANGIPERGTAWLDARLISALGIEVGDRITLGNAELRVSAVLAGEPLPIGGMVFGLAPRLMMNIEDLDRTGLVQPASRVFYRYLFAGGAATIAAFRKTITPLLRPGERIEGINDAQPQTRSALDRSRQFLRLAALVTVLLAGVAVAMSTRRFIARHLDGCAIMRCLGARQSAMVGLFAWQVVWLGMAAVVVGSIAGYLAQYGLDRVLAGLVSVPLVSVSFRPLVFGFLTAFITLLGFALPPLLHLKNVPALRVMRRELGAVPRAGIAVYAAGAGAMLLLILWQSGDPKLAGYTAAGVAGAIIVLMAVSGLLIGALRLLRPRIGGRFVLFDLTRRSGSAVIQVVGFGLGLTILLLLAVVRTDLMHTWEASLPPDAPNRFLINIQPAQLPELRQFFLAHNTAPPAFFPMAKGRLVAIDDRPVSPDTYPDERAKGLVRREFNLSWAATLQDDNHIVAGRWWTASERGERVVSVEQGLAKTLGIRLDDRLTFLLGDSEVTVRVASLREVSWDSFRVNFFVIAPPGVFDSYPTSYLCSLFVPQDRADLLNGLVRAYPNVTVIDVAVIMDEVRSIIRRAALAIEYVFGFTLVAGLLVMFAAVQATLDERIRETVLMRTLGAGRAQLLRGLILEFVGVGLLAGIVAASMASLLGYVLGSQIFHLSYAPDWRLWVIGGAAGAVAVGIAGLLGTRFVLDTPPVQALRETG